MGSHFSIENKHSLSDPPSDIIISTLELLKEILSYIFLNTPSIFSFGSLLLFSCGFRFIRISVGICLKDGKKGEI
eukprot:snap_masked-scaffold_16-processed-gene-5.30-mRNA-1 protein AED:1.00 eAED:1.00 QI:0/0/0/0/1/1/2/0/74